MVNVTVGQKIYVKVKRIKRLPEIVEATVKEIQHRYIVCTYFGRDYKFYRLNGKQVTQSSQPDELIVDIMAYNQQLEDEQLYKDAEKLLTNTVRFSRSHLPTKIKQLNLNEVKALKFLLQKIQ